MSVFLLWRQQHVMFECASVRSSWLQTNSKIRLGSQLNQHGWSGVSSTFKRFFPTTDWRCDCLIMKLVIVENYLLVTFLIVYYLTAFCVSDWDWQTTCLLRVKRKSILCRFHINFERTLIRFPPDWENVMWSAILYAAHVHPFYSRLSYTKELSGY